MNNTHQLFFWADVDTKATYLRRHVPAARAKKTARSPWSGVPWQSEGIQRDLSNHKHFEGSGRSKYPKTYCYIVWFKISTDTELVFLWFETFPSEVCWYWFWLFPCTSWVLSFNWVVSWLWSNIFFWDVHLVEVDRRLFQTIWKRHFAGRHPYSSLFIHHKNP